MPRIIRGACHACLLTGMVLALTACNAGTDDPDPAPVTTTQVLHDISTQVIYATYLDFQIKTDVLQKAVTLFGKAPNGANLSAAQKAWRDARVPWEANEGFLFGPVVTIPVDEMIDSWPINRVDLDVMLQSDDPLTKDFIDGLDGTLKGFHALEYLLFGDPSNAGDLDKYAAKLTPRELAYLQAVSASLKGKVDELVQAWNPAGGNFLGELRTAGKGSTLYATEGQALEELLNGIINICDEVSGEKMYRPFHAEPPDRNEEESHFSDNSTNDFADNLRSARNVYLGTYFGKGGKGLKALVEKKDPALAAKVETQLDAAIAATLAMGVYGDAMFIAPGKINTATTAIRDLRYTLAIPVTALLIED